MKVISRIKICPIWKPGTNLQKQKFRCRNYEIFFKNHLLASIYEIVSHNYEIMFLFFVLFSKKRKYYLVIMNLFFYYLKISHNYDIGFFL